MMLISFGLLILTVIAVGVTYVAHLQRRLLEAQDTLINHFIDLVRVEVRESARNSNNDFSKVLALRR